MKDKNTERVSKIKNEILEIISRYSEIKGASAFMLSEELTTYVLKVIVRTYEKALKLVKK